MIRKPELSPRLAAVASMVPEGARLADIGTDHAYLPVYLLLSGRVKSAIAADLRPGPLSRARATAQEYHCHGISFRLCDGLSGIEPEEADTVVIAGMGGETIAKILSGSMWVREDNLSVILQPMSSQPELRRWLWQNGYVIQREQLVQEGDSLYLSLSVKAGSPSPMTSAQEWAGRQHPEMDAPLRGTYLALLLKKVSFAMEGLSLSKQGRDSERYREMEDIYRGLLDMKEEWEQWRR